MAQRWKKAGSLAGGGLSLNVFTQDEMDAIHRATLEVLEHTGVLIGSPEARALLTQAGASVVDEDIVRFPQWMVADAVACAAVLHYKKETVAELKEDIRAGGVEVRRV